MKRGRPEGIFRDDSSEEEGQIADSSRYPSRVDKSQPEGAEMYDSSEENPERMADDRRRREELHRLQRAQGEKYASLGEEQLLSKAFDDLERTNRRVLAMRERNERRMGDIAKVRMTQQPYLVSNNTHYRGGISEYPLLTIDKNGKTLYHPNYSLRVGEMRLGEFIQKNIKEETTANYLNEVVKFENYAYQQRKKRRHHIE